MLRTCLDFNVLTSILKNIFVKKLKQHIAFLSTPALLSFQRTCTCFLLFCIMQCRVKYAKCKLSKTAKYQLDPRGDLPML